MFIVHNAQCWGSLFQHFSDIFRHFSDFFGGVPGVFPGGSGIIERSSREVLGVFRTTLFRLFSDMSGKVPQYFAQCTMFIVRNAQGRQGRRGRQGRQGRPGRQGRQEVWDPKSSGMPELWELKRLEARHIARKKLASDGLK